MDSLENQSNGVKVCVFVGRPWYNKDTSILHIYKHKSMNHKIQVTFSCIILFVPHLLKSGP